MKKEKRIDISVIIPIFNEEKNIPLLYDRLKKTLIQISYNYEIIFINDGSKDNSLLEILKLTELDANIYYIDFSRNFGHQIAISAGIDYCRGEAVVIIDADLQDAPELIIKLYDKYKEGYDVVYAKRLKRKGENIFKKITAKLFYRILRNITNINIPVDTGDYRLIDKKIVEYLKHMPEHNKFLRGQIAWLGFKQTEILYIRDKRIHGKTGYSFNKMLNFALDGIIGFSDKPLQLVTKMGLYISLLSIIIILYALYSNFILNKVITGWTSLIISSMFIGGIQLFSIGVIGEYINRINKNIQNRPLYVIEKENITNSTQNN